MSAHERSDWRDRELSKRHRDLYGMNCPATDLDFLMIEYDHALPVAIIDYKHFQAFLSDLLTNKNYEAVRNLARRAGPGLTELPYFIARYWPDRWAYHVIPMNGAAERVLGNRAEMTEREFVQFLYQLRNRVLTASLLNLRSDKPPSQLLIARQAASANAS